MSNLINGENNTLTIIIKDNEWNPFRIELDWNVAVCINVIDDYSSWASTFTYAIIRCWDICTLQQSSLKHESIGA